MADDNTANEFGDVQARSRGIRAKSKQYRERARHLIEEAKRLVSEGGARRAKLQPQNKIQQNEIQNETARTQNRSTAEPQPDGNKRKHG